MSFAHGKKAVVKVDDSGGTPRDITAYTTRAGFPRTADVADVSALGTDDKSYVVGLRDARFTAEGKFDPTVDGYLSGILGQAATVTVEYGPQGSTVGNVKYTFEAILVSYEGGTGLDDAGTWTAEFQASGAVTRTTY